MRAALAPPAQQAPQLEAFGGTAPRMAATRPSFTPQFQLKGMACVQSGQPAWRFDFTAPMEHATTDEQVDAMTMDLNVDDKEPTLLTFVVSWCEHTLSMPMKAKIG